MVDTTANVRRGLDPAGQKLIDDFSAARAQLAKLTLQPPQAASAAANAAPLAAAESEVQRLEKLLSEKGAALTSETRSTTIADVRQAIPPDAALIEFVRYRPFDPKALKMLERFGPARFAAFVVGRDTPVRWIELGPADPIEKSVTAWRAALRSPQRSDVKALGRAVDELVGRPLREAGIKASHLIVSPDGSLNLIPFAALVDERDRYLVDRYQISYVTSGRDLLRLADERHAQRSPLVIADPAFGERGADAPAANRTLGENVRFSPLPGTAAEAAAIAKLLPEARVETGKNATEAIVKAVHGPSILHIASHGFFFDYAASGPATDARGLKLVSGGTAEVWCTVPTATFGPCPCWCGASSRRRQ